MTAELGVSEPFRVDDRESVDAAIVDLEALNARLLRVPLSWADWAVPEGRKFYEWLAARVPRSISLLFCVGRTPPSVGVVERPSAPPRDARRFGALVEELVLHLGDRIEWLELWGPANDVAAYDYRLDPEWYRFAEMVASAAAAARARGKKLVLSATRPFDPNWLRVAGERGLLEQVDALAMAGWPKSFDGDWHDWSEQIARTRAVMERFGVTLPLWITDTGYPTWRHDERAQLRALVAALDEPVERVYWSRLFDLPAADVDDPRLAHLGLKRVDGTPKLLYRLLADGGLEAVREVAWAGLPHRAKKPYVLVTGGAGFVGTNLADRLAREGTPVLVYDNLSRPGVERNLRWLKKSHGDRVQVEIADVRDRRSLERAAERASAIFHFAAQVAVTTSLEAPGEDFEVNARGTLELLECLRRRAHRVPLVFTSTNKVYGALEDVPLVERGLRYEPTSAQLRDRGVSEDRPVRFCSPYGCSKGAADVLDWAHTFGLPTCVLRMSCIYGPHQLGNEDQGWVAHFLIRAIERQPITIYGDGKQVRDVLFVDDLVDALLLAMQHIERLRGEAFNVGGGPANTLSLLELVGFIESLTGERPALAFADWRTADQRYYVSDVGRLEEAIGWAPRVGVREGVERLYRWLLESHGLSRPRLLAGEVGR